MKRKKKESEKIVEEVIAENVVLDKTLENPSDYKEIKPVNPKGNQP